MGVQGIQLEDIKKCEQALYETLQDVAKNGIEERFFETTLHQIEFSAKRTKDHFGLACLSHMVPYALHGGDPLSIFKINEFSNRIREDFKKGDLFQGLVKKYLLNNTHKMTLLAVPDQEVGPKEEAAEKRRLDALKKALTEQEKETIVQDAFKLKQHQERI
jgi:presequence protease